MGNPNKSFRKMGKAVLTEANVDVPANVDVSVKNKVVTVSGPRGKISKSFGNAAVLLRPTEDKSGKKLNIAIWFKNRKQKSLAKTMASLVDNMVIGVTSGYRYVMKYGHKRHPMMARILRSKITWVPKRSDQLMPQLVSILNATRTIKPKKSLLPELTTNQLVPVVL